MDPIVAKQLLDRGEITQATYDAAIAGQASVNTGSPAANTFAGARTTSEGPLVLAPASEGPPLVLAPSDDSAFAGARTTNTGPLVLAPPANQDAGFAGVKTSDDGGAPGETMSHAPVSPSPAPAPAPVMQSSMADQMSVQNSSQAPASPLPSAPGTPSMPPARTWGAPTAPSGPRPLTSSELRDQQLSGRVKTSEGYGDREKAADAAIADAESEGAQKAAFMINQQLSDEEQTIKRRDNQQLQAYELAKNTYQSLADRYKALGNQDIDPERKWKSLSGGEKFATGAAIFLGGAAGGLGDGRFAHSNPGLQQWDRKIDQDIQAQAANIENKRHALDAEDNVTAKQYALNQDMVGYYNAKKVEGWTQVQHRLDSLAQETKSETVKRQLELAMVQVDKKVDEARNNLQDYQFANLQRKEQIAAAAAAAQAARVEAQRKEIRDMTKHLVQEKGMSVDDARATAIDAVTGMKVMHQTPVVPSDEELKYRWNTSKDPAAKEKLEDDMRAKALQSGYNDAEAYKGYFGKEQKGDLTSKLGLQAVPGTDAKTYALRVDDWNAQSTLALGPVVEAMNKGKPGAVELRTLQSEIHMTPGMSQQEKIARINRLQELQRNAASITQHQVGKDGLPSAPKRPTVNWEK